jgi:hypothetical protein
MPVLRLTQYTAGPDQYRVVVNLREDDPYEAPEEAIVHFPFRLTEQEQEDLRWYLEDFLQYPLDPEPKRAARVEQRMAEIGRQLFEAIFDADAAARDLWAVLRRNLNQTRVEVAVEDIRQAAAVPWELLRDPRTDVSLALHARAFVRTHTQPSQKPKLPRPSPAGERIRILLVICRPGGRDDVPFRSVASRLIKGLSEEARQLFQLDVLRPPTFAQLSRELREANTRGQPYHIVHFDGHGTYLDVPDPAAFTPSNLMFKGLSSGAHGYLVFEAPDQADKIELVDGVRLGNLLVETNVPVLVLNACRSAHAETAAGEAQPASAPAENAPAEAEAAAEAQAGSAFGSLAQEVMDTGVAGVVAMRYNVYVVTAAQFVADLYAALGQGQALGEAVSFGRKQLHADPQRTIAYDPVDLQDWLVPVVYEAAPIRLFPQQAEPGQALQIDLGPTDYAPRDVAGLPTPDTGFIGRDETLLALDRAFDSQAIVLLHAYAGSGKTATAAEFARWYHLTGGLEGPVLFTSFEQPQPLPQVLDTLGQVFESALAQIGINWLALPEAGRRDVALQVMQQIPLLWIWDNVEPVTGFPRPEDASLTEAQQAELADFLRAARDTQAKFLLTSRRDEQAWLGHLPRRIIVPPMPMQERVQLARALAEKYGADFTQVADWRPLLHFTQGNPLTITTLVGQALRQGLTRKEQIEQFVRDLQQGAAEIEDEAEQGRVKSLAASLGYGFEHAFNETERQQLALLHFFQGFVGIPNLLLMSNPKVEWSLPILHGVTVDDLKTLLNRAAGIGLLTPLGRDSGYYTIHPALPWFFKAMFEQYYPEAPLPTSPHRGEELKSDSPPPEGEELGEGVRAARAFVEVMGQLGNYYHDQYIDGNREVIALLEREEANLCHARYLALRYARSTKDVARQNEWLDVVISTMQGLDQLYDHTGRRAEWRRLVEEIVPDFVDPATGGPLPGREEQWSLVTEYRVRLAREVRDWAEAERIQRLQVEVTRQRAAPFLAETRPEGFLKPFGSVERNAIRTLAISIEELAHILREQGKSECIKYYEEALSLKEHIGNQPDAAVTAFNLGHAYLTLPDRRDLAQAERWYQRSLELHEERDRLGQSKCYNQLGAVGYEQFKEARSARQAEAVLRDHLNTALSRYHQALDLLPANAVNDLAVAHGQLGNIYNDAGDIDRALPHYRECIRYFEAAGDRYHAAGTRFNVAVALEQAGRLADARDYAEAARRNFEQFGAAAADLAERARGLLADIVQAMRGA